MVDATEYSNSSIDHKKKKELPADLPRTIVINKNTGLWEIAPIVPLYVFCRSFGQTADVFFQ